MAPLPEPRNHAAAAGLDGCFYVSGGGGPADNDPEDEIWALDPGRQRLDRGRADAGGPLRPPHGGAGRPPLRGRRPGGDQPRADLRPGQRYVVDRRRDAGVQRNHLAAVAAGGRSGPSAGGSAASVEDRVDIYDPTTDTWSPGRPLPEATSAASEGVLGSVIVISGGEAPGENGRHGGRSLAAGHGRRARMRTGGRWLRRRWPCTAPRARSWTGAS